MRRLLLAVAALCAFAAFAAASATAAGPTLSVSATPVAPTAADQLTITATGTSATGIALYADAGVTCEVAATLEEEPLATAAFEAGSQSFSETLPAGTYAVNVWTYGPEGEYVADDCTIVTVDAAPGVPAVPSDEASGSYLCWNHVMASPVAYVDKVADAMWKTGNYFEPQAILGHVEGGVNLGAYHLVCNAPDTMKMTELGLGGSGEVYGADATAAYHHEHSGGNDLNVYHIWR